MTMHIENLIDFIANAVADRVIQKLKMHSQTDDEEILDVEGVCQLIGVTKYWVYKKVNEGLPYIKMGKYLRFNKKEVLNWIRQRSSSLRR